MARYSVIIQDPADTTERSVTITADRDDKVIDEVAFQFGEVIVIDFEEIWEAAREAMMSAAESQRITFFR